ncbi:HPr family phosphocarrier protein [Rouxiella sp. T17]|uniref:HPr family phosphocarrier protein n=1 Tax=Rouxiella sp. T17 TaxID=3085684 RepID=UPI002FC78B10
MPKFAANLSTMFTEYPFLERFAAAAKAGFKGVEFLFPYDYPIADLKQALTDNQLEMVLFNTSPGDTAAGEWGVSAIPGREQEARKHIDLALEYAVALGCKQIHIMAAVVPEGANRQDYYATFIDNLRYAADRFAPHGITVLLEALNPKTKPNYLYSSQYETLELVKKVGKENIFTQLDLFHAQLVDGNLSHLITEYSGQYKHIQIASAPDRHEPDEGEINYPWIFDLLDKRGYSGWIGCEYLPRTTTLDGLGWFQQYK